MVKEVYVCDECGAERKEANHWFSAESHSLSEKDDVIQIGTYVELLPWSGWAKSPGAVHLCGQACVHAALDRFMSTGTIEK